MMRSITVLLKIALAYHCDTMHFRHCTDVNVYVIRAIILVNTNSCMARYYVIFIITVLQRKKSYFFL